jgi:ABC-type transport system involved in cytochrome bd biosynthesis fused ATPase/permease subunit
MDAMLLKVIMMLLAVSFLEFMLTSGIGNLNWTVLVVPLTIIALALGLRWMSAASLEEEEQEAQAETGSTGRNRTLDKLERLAALYERGAISDAEFEITKKSLW